MAIATPVVEVARAVLPPARSAPRAARRLVEAALDAHGFNTAAGIARVPI